MNKQISVVLLILFFGANAFAQEAKKPNTKKLKADFQKLMKTETVSKTKVGVYAVDVNTGEVLIDINGDRAFNPASNAKIVTSAVAFEKFGASKAWATRLSAGALKDGEVQTLYVKSDGDPLLLYDDFVKWAIFLKQQGVKKVSGGIVVDTGAFGDTLPPGFDQFDEDASYRPDIASFSVNYNMVSVVVEPTEPGKPARVFTRPPNSHVEVIANVKTDKSRRAKVTAKAEKTKSGTKVTLNGTIGKTSTRYVARKRVDYPSVYAADVLKNALTEVGIDVKGAARTGTRPANAVTLHFHLSQPLWYSASLMNKYSNNFIAEQIYMLLGSQKNGPASVDVARTAVTDFMKDAKVDANGFKTFNGSGLYVGNQVSPKQVAEILKYMTTLDVYPEFAASLAVSGGDGTLRTRLRKSKGSVRGKTGTLSAVSALSGYLRTKSGRMVAYSVLFNDPPIHGARMRKIQDAMVERIRVFKN